MKINNIPNLIGYLNGITIYPCNESYYTIFSFKELDKKEIQKFYGKLPKYNTSIVLDRINFMLTLEFNLNLNIHDYIKSL